MTRVQAETLDGCLSGRDCLARAKTGTGKTLAFLIPAVEAMLRRGQELQKDSLCTIVLSPTRELANQIAKEANILLSCLPQQRVVSVTGGTNRSTNIKELSRGPIAVLVATPGRLIDHLENTPGFGARCGRVCTLVFDEADNLLDMGFKRDIDKIMAFMPRREERQTLLFSATVPPAVRQIAKVTLDPNYEFVDTVGDEEEQTHVHVAQTAVVVALEDLWASAFTAILSQMAASGPEHKIIVFCTTARMTGYMADLFRQYLSSGSPRTAGLRTNVLEIHSRKSQHARTKTSDMFRDGQSMILFSSDVSARGMDYPNVTFVLQVGMTDKEQYVHRLGRTARAGKGGGGMILLHDFEERIMLQKHLSEMPITTVSGQSLGITAAEFAAVQGVVTASLRNIEMKKSAEQTYQAWLGFYNSHLRDLQWDKPYLVQMANRFAGTMGFPSDSPPALFAKTVGKMGLKGVPGLKIDKNPDTSGNAGNNRGRFGGNK
jgi:ATP-dependent RNA helicase MSS116, mitochondrial